MADFFGLMAEFPWPAFSINSDGRILWVDGRLLACISMVRELLLNNFERSTSQGSAGAAYARTMGHRMALVIWPSGWGGRAPEVAGQEFYSLLDVIALKANAWKV